MKAFFALVVLVAALVFSPPAAQAQTAEYPTTNRIVYSTNAIELQDSTTKFVATVKKGTVRILTRGTGVGASAAIIEPTTKLILWKGAVNKIRIVGVAASDSLKILSLKATPF
jgi:hypothetical protein